MIAAGTLPQRPRVGRRVLVNTSEHLAKLTQLEAVIIAVKPPSTIDVHVPSYDVPMYGLEPYPAPVGGTAYYRWLWPTVTQ